MNRIIVEGISIGNTIPFPVEEGEVVAYALDEVGLLGSDTRIDEQPARTLLQGFFAKRERFRENSRLGQLMVSDFGVTHTQLVEALNFHEAHSVPLGVAFIRLDICDRATIDRALSRQLSLRKQLP